MCKKPGRFSLVHGPLYFGGDSVDGGTNCSDFNLGHPGFLLVLDGSGVSQEAEMRLDLAAFASAQLPPCYGNSPTTNEGASMRSRHKQRDSGKSGLFSLLDDRGHPCRC